MSVFSTNQVRQLYVAKATNASVNAKLTGVEAAGTIAVIGDKKDLYLDYVGAGGRTRSDLIQVKDIMSAKATPASALAMPMKKYKVVLDPAVNGGKVISGLDYLLRIFIQNHIGMNDDASTVKYGAVHGYKGMSADTFYEKMYESLVANFSRELNKPFNFSVSGVKATVTLPTNSTVTVTAKVAGPSGNNITFTLESVSAGAAVVKVDKSSGKVDIKASLTAGAKNFADLKNLIAGDAAASKYIEIGGSNSGALSTNAKATLVGGTATGLIVEEKPQEWILGTFPQVPVNFTLITPSVILDGEELNWGVITKETTTNFVEDGHKIADLEYFCMGERGDLYRNIGWPEVIKTTYLVDPDKKYNTIDIHYAFIEGGENPQRSEKDITIAVDASGGNTLTNKIITAINSATGLTIASL